MLLRMPCAIFAAALMLLSHSAASGQYRLWGSVLQKPLTKFSWNCAETSWHPSSRVRVLVQDALRRHDNGPPRYGDRAFAYDLNDDGQREVFVPLTCGATGNCSWAVLATKNARLLGIVGGENLYVYRGHRQWPVIIAYGHVTAVEGELLTYRFRHGRYALAGKSYAINHGEYDLDVQGGRGHKMPLFLQRAREACESVGF